MIENNVRKELPSLAKKAKPTSTKKPTKPRTKSKEKTMEPTKLSDTEDLLTFCKACEIVQAFTQTIPQKRKLSRNSQMTGSASYIQQGSRGSPLHHLLNGGLKFQSYYLNCFMS